MTITSEEQETYDCKNCIYNCVCVWYPWDGLDCNYYTPFGVNETKNAIILPPERHPQHLPPPIPTDYPLINYLTWQKGGINNNH